MKKNTAASEAARLLASLRKNPGGQKVYHPCRYCRERFSAIQVRKHQPLCKENPRNKKKLLEASA